MVVYVDRILGWSGFEKISNNHTKKEKIQKLFDLDPYYPKN